MGDEYEYQPLNKDGTCPEGCERVQDPNWKYKYDGCSMPAGLAVALSIAKLPAQYTPINLVFNPTDLFKKPAPFDKDSPSSGGNHLFSNPQHTGPCDKHDKCYQTYSSDPEAKNKCDKAMKEAMKKVCNGLPAGKQRNDCLFWAKIYYTALQKTKESRKAFEDRQKQVSKCRCKKQKPKPTNVKPQGRLKDKASAPHDNKVCDKCPHPVAGPAVQGSPNVFVNKRPALRVNSRGQHNASDSHNGTPNTWVAKTGSTSVFINGQPAHRLADATEHIGGGTGQLMEGSPNVLVG